jgi:hypothetical protein
VVAEVPMVPVAVARRGHCYGKLGLDRRRPDEQRIRNWGLRLGSVIGLRDASVGNGKGSVGGIAVDGTSSLDGTKSGP